MPRPQDMLAGLGVIWMMIHVAAVGVAALGLWMPADKDAAGLSGMIALIAGIFGMVHLWSGRSSNDEPEQD